MNRRELTPRDERQLNDYIDGRLSSHHKAEFEARLEKSVQLQRKLLEHKQLKASLRALPQLKSPRNFTLTPAMVKVRRERLKLANGFSFASAGVAILLMLAFAGEFVLGSGFPLMAKRSAEVPMAAMMEMSAETDGTEEPVIIFWNALPPGEVSGMGGGGGNSLNAVGMGGGEIYDDTTPKGVGIEPQPEIASALENDQTIAEDSSASKTDGDKPSETIILGLRLDEQTKLTPVEQANALWQKSMQWLSGFSPLRWVQFGLVSLLVGFGVAAISLRKRIRH